MATDKQWEAARWLGSKLWTVYAQFLPEEAERQFLALIEPEPATFSSDTCYPLHGPPCVNEQRSTPEPTRRHTDERHPGWPDRRKPSPEPTQAHADSVCACRFHYSPEGRYPSPCPCCGAEAHAPHPHPAPEATKREWDEESLAEALRKEYYAPGLSSGTLWARLARLALGPRP